MNKLTERTEDYKIKITKTSELENAEFLNNIPINDIRIGYTGVRHIQPKIGEGYYIRDVITKNGKEVKGLHRGFLTSMVQSFTGSIGQKIFRIHTINSIYKIEILPDD